MNGRLSGFTREWKIYVLLVGMVVIAGYLYHIDGKIAKLTDRLDQVSSTIESVEGITTGTDYTLKEIESQVNRIEAQVSTIAQRVKRRK
jgi:archaellum component FlaC